RCSGLFGMPRGFELVAVEIDDERAIVVGTVHLARTRSAVILAACGEGGLVEFVDGVLGSRRETDVHAIAHARRLLILRQLYPKRGPDDAIRDCVGHEFHHALVTKCAKRSVIELRRAGNIADADRDMMQHLNFPPGKKRDSSRLSAAVKEKATPAFSQ